VFGTGTVAEYARAREGTLAPEPASLTFEQVAAVPVGGLATLLGIGGAIPSKSSLTQRPAAA